MFFLEFSWFVLLFVIFPFFHASTLYRLVLRDTNSPFVAYTYACLFTVAADCLILTILYLLFNKQADFVYLAVIIGINILAICIFSSNHIKMFMHEFIEEIKPDFFRKILILFSFLGLSYAIILIRPFSSDLLDYFEIGKIFYSGKKIVYTGLILNDANAFGAHVFHPPFYTLLTSLGYLIQGTTAHFRVNSYISAYFTLTFLTMMLVIMRKNYVLGFAIVTTGILASNYATSMFIMPNGLDAFRCSYFLLSFAILGDLLAIRSTSLQWLFGLSLAASLSVHSSGLLFVTLIFIIFFASYIEKKGQFKYWSGLKIALVALSFGGAQYALNLYNTGKLISDDVAVWSQLDYYTYMRFERNIYNKTRMFKEVVKEFYPFNNQSKFGCFFFAALFLGLVRIRSYIPQIQQAFFNFIAFKQKPLPQYSEHLLFILGFYIVLMLSILAGQELILKNFRYLFTVYPSILIFIYSALNTDFFSLKLIFTYKKIGKIKRKQFKKIIVTPELFGIFFIMLGLTASYGLFKKIRTENIAYSFTPNEFLQQHKNMNLNKLLPGMRNVVDYLKKNSMPHQSVLAFDNGQLYQFFFTLKIYNYLNDDFMPLYKMNETVDLYNALKAKHIKYIFVSSYQPSTLLQSQFSNLITDPKYTTLVVNQGNYFLFKINDKLKEVPNAALSTNEEDDVQLTKSTSKIIIYKLKNNKQYSIDIKSLAPGVFYQIAAHTSTRSIANYTFNTNTKFIFFSGPIEQEQLSLEITSKDKPVDLNIKIREIL